MTQSTLQSKPRVRLNYETPEEQSKKGKTGGLRKLDSNQIEAIWDEVQLHTRMTFRWTPHNKGA